MKSRVVLCMTWLASVAGCHMDTMDLAGEGTVTPQESKDAFEGKDVVQAPDPGPEAAAPCIHVAPVFLDFDTVAVGASKTRSFLVDGCGGVLRITSIALGPSAGPEFSLLGFPSGITPQQPLVLGAGDALTVSVRFAPTAPSSSAKYGSVRVESVGNDPIVVDLAASAKIPPCPEPVIVVTEGDEVAPQTVVHLRGDQSIPGTGEITKYRWTVVQPQGNAFALMPSGSFPHPTHEANVAGTYVYSLDVCDQVRCSDDPGCGTTASRKVIVVPCSGCAHIELTWDTPNDPDQVDEGPDAGSDMDLHVAHPYAGGEDVDKDGKPDGWFDLPWDCFWFNPHPALNAEESWCSLDRDDTDGAGPENANLPGFKAETYRVGVHYWDAHGYGASVPRVRIYVYGILVFDALGVKMKPCDFWEVATIEFPSGKVTAVTNVDGSSKITPKYVNTDFLQTGGDVCKD